MDSEVSSGGIRLATDSPAGSQASLQHPSGSPAALHQDACMRVYCHTDSRPSSGSVPSWSSKASETAGMALEGCTCADASHRLMRSHKYVKAPPASCYAIRHLWPRVCSTSPRDLHHVS